VHQSWHIDCTTLPIPEDQTIDIGGDE
jgi:hypothetical protein